MTAVEFLHSEYKKVFGDMSIDIQKMFAISDSFAEAKEMEKQQLKEMYLKGIENYDPTFNKICEHCYITSADRISQTCSKCNHRINL
jgi:hypothetical protein